jgi:hypothetical protein
MGKFTTKKTIDDRVPFFWVKLQGAISLSIANLDRNPKHLKERCTKGILQERKLN